MIKIIRQHITRMFKGHSKGKAQQQTQKNLSHEERMQRNAKKYQTTKQETVKKEIIKKGTDKQNKKSHSNKNQQPHSKSSTHKPHQEHKRRKPKHKKETVTLPTTALVIPPVKEEYTRFSDLELNDEILYGLQDLNFQYCTPIQAKSLPISLKGNDITGQAQTGTGKTAAFLITIFNHLLNNPVKNRQNGDCRAVILAPTRELVMQIHKDAMAIGKYCGLYNVVVFGGMDREKQRHQLDQPIDILIGTPGRMIDFMNNRNLNFSRSEFLVIDEADRMLDMGFIPDVKRIVSRLPKKEERMTMFFSATFTFDVELLVKKWLTEPTTIESEPEKMVTDLIEQKFYSVLSNDKFKLLCWILKNEKIDRMLIFINRKDLSVRLQRQLSRERIFTEIMSGDVQQQKRIKVLDDFKSGKTKIIIATDVAARGIHVDDISHVINYDIPVKAEDYVHRIGRTGRAGKKGKSISFVCEHGAYTMPELEDLLERSISCEQPSGEMINAN